MYKYCTQNDIIENFKYYCKINCTGEWLYLLFARSAVVVFAETAGDGSFVECVEREALSGLSVR